MTNSTDAATLCHLPPLELAKHHMEQGKASFTSWSMAGDAGLPDFQEALRLQHDEFGHSLHPSMAETFYWVGRANHKIKYFEESIDSFQKALQAAQGHYQGHYSHQVGEIYIALGASYADQGSLEKALVAFSTARRIETRIYGLGPWQTDSSKIRPILSKLGQTETDILSRLEYMDVSLSHEIKGDLFLEEHNLEPARKEYLDAVHAEELKFGIYNANLAMLRRKIALTHVDCKVELEIDFSKKCPVKVPCGLIMKGDKFFLTGEYIPAIESYKKANLLGQTTHFKAVVLPLAATLLLAAFVRKHWIKIKLYFHKKRSAPMSPVEETKAREDAIAIVNDVLLGSGSHFLGQVHDEQGIAPTHQDTSIIVDDELVNGGSRILGQAMARDLEGSMISTIAREIEHPGTQGEDLPGSSDWTLQPSPWIRKFGREFPSK